MEKLSTNKQYDEVKARVEQLIAEATAKGLLEPDMDNDYTREISLLSQQMAAYEDEYLNILPLRQKSSTPSSASMPISSLSTPSQGYKSKLANCHIKNKPSPVAL